MFLWKLTERKKRLPEKGGGIIEYTRLRASVEARHDAKNAIQGVFPLRLIHIHIYNIFIILQGGDDDF